MTMSKHEENLGPPALKVCGLQLWIHGREIPASQDYYDGNWLNVTVHCGANSASVWASGSFLMVPDLVFWLKGCEDLYAQRNGEAILNPFEPNLLITIRPLDKIGHLVMRVEITPEHLSQQHRFDFAMDQSYLPSLMAQCRAIIAEYPVRGA